MKVYTAINQKENKVYSATSASNVAGFIGCHPNYLRDKLREETITSVKGYLVTSCELDKIGGRGGFIRDNYRH